MSSINREEYHYRVIKSIFSRGKTMGQLDNR